MARIKTYFSIGFFCLGLSLGWGKNADAAGFMKYDGIDGESTDKSHTKWIHVLSVQFATPLNTGSAPSCPAAPSGPGDIVIVKQLDAATPKLQEAACNGSMAPMVQIHLHQARRSDVESFRWQLMNTRVIDYRVSSRPDKKGNAIPVEEITLNYSEVTWTYEALGRE